MAIACYAHPSFPTVAECADCTRGLCTTCEHLLRPPLCVDCAEARAAVIVSAIRRRLTSFTILALAGFAAGLYLLTIHPPSDVFGVRLPVVRLPHVAYWLPPLLAYLLGGIVYGRHALGRGVGGTFIMTFSMMITLGFIKFIVGALIGPVVTPFMLGSDLENVRKQRALTSGARRAAGLPAAGAIVPVPYR